MDESRECRLLQTRVFEENCGLVVRQLTDLGFQPGREGDDVGTLSRGFLPKGLQFRGLFANLVLPDVGDVEHRLGREEGKALEEFRLLWLKAQGAKGFPLVKVGRQQVEELQLLLLLGARLAPRRRADPFSSL